MKVMQPERLEERGERLAALGRALSHPARVAILDVLAARGTCVCGQIVDELPLAQSTVSQHLKVLKEAGLIRGDIDGVRTCYGLDPSGLRLLRETLTPFLDRLETAASSCC